MICYNVRMKMRMTDVVGRMGRGLGGGFAGVRGHSLRRGLRCALLLAVTGLSGVAGAVTAFDAAESVWPAGLAEEMNTLIAFRAPFELKAGERPVLKMVAWYSYRVTLNGAFVGFGPARGPKGFFRPDEWDLAAAARPGRNELCVEVAGYNVPNFYLMEQPPFFKAEVVCADRVLAATKRVGGAFAATRQPRVQKVPRYSFQRTFVEAYRLPAAAHPPALALAAAPEPALIERRVPYPDFEVNPRMTPVSFAKVRYDETAPVRQDRSLSLPGQAGGGFKGFPLADLELNASFLAQRLISSDRRPATAAEKGAATFRLATGESAVFDNGLNDSGFPGLRVEVAAPGRLVLQFDEVLSEGGEARGIKRYKDCCNVILWDFAEPGVYEVDAFEPYTMRYVELAVVSGDMTVSAPRFRSYKNPTAKRARFQASDPALVKIFDAANETFRQNAADVFMDCPSRERAGWNCDAFFTAPASTLLTGDFALERVFEENHALPPAFDDIADGAIPMCYPADHRDRVHIPNWAMWFTLETEEYLRRTGDRETVDALRPRLEKLVKYLWTFRNGDGLLERLPSWVFVEWSHANKLVQDVNYPSNMTWADTLDAMDRLYGRPDLAAEAARVRETVRRQSWTGTWFCDNAVRQKDGTLKLSGECTETCQYYAFFHRVATPETHPALWRRLLEDFGPQRYDPNDRTKMLKHPEIWPSNAFIGNYLRLKLLERAGRGQQILDETKGYFLYMAARTGTLWENDTTCASCNHGFASYAAVLLVRSVLGAEVDHLQKTVTVRPTDVDLASCGVTLPVSGGELSYGWTRKDGRREETFAAPPDWRLVRSDGAPAADTAEASRDVLVEAEAFAARGGWVTDTQFMDQMGSPFLLAHGLGTPVADARTTFDAGAGGRRVVYVRTRNWNAPWSAHPAGLFQVAVNGETLPLTLGAGASEWTWRRAGEATLKPGANALALHDLTGFEGRCDALVFAAGERTAAELDAFRTAAHAAKPVARKSYDFVVVGGGIAGVCAAVTAARQGLKTALVHDRPVLGGNNSSEVRVHLGAYANLPPYPRLGDVLAEIAPAAGGNAQPAAVYEDGRKLAVVKAEKNLDLFLDTHVNAVEKAADGAIAAVVGVDTATGARTVFAAPLFADTTGDGTVGFLAGADFRMGREGRDEMGEPWAPEAADRLTMGASVQWRATTNATAMSFLSKPWMLPFDERTAQPGLRGDWDWETGMLRDQVAEFERVRDYGQLVVYSNWAYLKNAYSERGEFATASLDWVAYNAGKRESRRLLGDFILTENHLMARDVQPDGTCAATWTIDQHFPKEASVTGFAGEAFQADSHNHQIWPYPIPYRCFYSRNVPNLFMAGRDISVTHVALGTTRLMRTHGMMGEVVGLAAAVCRENACRPRAVYATHFTALKAKMEKGAGDGKVHPLQTYNCQISLDPDLRRKVQQVK